MQLKILYLQKLYRYNIQPLKKKEVIAYNVLYEYALIAHLIDTWPRGYE